MQLDGVPRPRRLCIRAINLRRFNQIAQAHESLIPLSGNGIDVGAQLRQPLRFELPDAIASIPFAADQACTLQSVKVLRHGLARDTRP